MDRSPKFISQEQQVLFDRFLLGQMTAKDSSELKKELEENTKLKAQFEEYKELFHAIEEEGLRTVLDDFHHNLPKEKPLEKNRFYRYQIAAGIAVLLSLGIWLFNQQNPNERLYNRYFAPDPGLPTVMGTQENFAFYDAMVDYKQGKYEVAIGKWADLLRSKPNNDTLNYFLGVANMALDNIELGKEQLKRASDTEGSVFLEEIHFFLGMAHLKSGEIPEAKKNLKLSNTAKAQEVLKAFSNE